MLLWKNSQGNINRFLLGGIVSQDGKSPIAAVRIPKEMITCLTIMDDTRVKIMTTNVKEMPAQGGRNKEK